MPGTRASGHKAAPRRLSRSVLSHPRRPEHKFSLSGKGGRADNWSGVWEDRSSPMPTGQARGQSLGAPPGLTPPAHLVPQLPHPCQPLLLGTGPGEASGPWDSRAREGPAGGVALPGCWLEGRSPASAQGTHSGKAEHLDPLSRPARPQNSVSTGLGQMVLLRGGRAVGLAGSAG